MTTERAVRRPVVEERSRRPVRPVGLTGADAVIVAATLVALALRLYQMLRPGFLTGVDEYDDGVYFGSAVRLIHGVLPYRDFVLVHPPGITLLLTPIALLTQSGGTAGGFAVARVVTALAGAAAVPVAGLMVRHRGALAAVAVCGILAVYPAGINAAHTVLLEPWLVLFCLLGAWAMFAGDEVSQSRRRLAWGGAAFGFACAVKLWAVIPALVALALCWRAARRPGFLAGLRGAVLGFGLPVVPFVILAPSAFYRGVIVAQLSRIDISRVPGVDRLDSLTGLSVFSGAGHALVYLVSAAAVLVVAACLALAVARERRAPPALDLFALLSAAIVLIAFLYPADFYIHYSWFFAPFGALSLGLALSWAAAPTRWVSAVLAVVAAAALVVPTVIQFHQLSQLSAGRPGDLARRQIRPGACVLTDVIALAIISDRFVSTTPGCSNMVDPIGSDYALSRGRNGVNGAGRTPAVQRLWLDAFRHADYVWLSCPPHSSPTCLTDRRIPWTPAVLGYFRAHFTPYRGRDALRNLFVRRA